MAALLETRALSKSFGALKATDDVSLTVAATEIHAVIGPNGAGKTTLIAELTGELAPDSGSVLFDGAEITRLPVWRRSRLGIARSFQITTLLQQMSALDNVALAVQARAGSSFRFFGIARQERGLRDAALALLVRADLAAAADTRCADLSHGEHRQLEMAVALALKPRLLLLDEPLAGMGHADSQRMIGLLRSLKGSVAILLVEHDMDAVFALADRVSVLVYGRLLATGTPQAIRDHAAVRDAYLGAQGD
jgi:branched-chain amino acid transport system ATP-binding protein